MKHHQQKYLEIIEDFVWIVLAHLKILDVMRKIYCLIKNLYKNLIYN